jgi:hypothetical protein
LLTVLFSVIVMLIYRHPFDPCSHPDSILVTYKYDSSQIRFALPSTKQLNVFYACNHH